MRMMMKRNPDNELLCLAFAVHDEDAGEAVADDAADDIDGKGCRDAQALKAAARMLTTIWEATVRAEADADDGQKQA